MDRYSEYRTQWTAGSAVRPRSRCIGGSKRTCAFGAGYWLPCSTIMSGDAVLDRATTMTTISAEANWMNARRMWPSSTMVRIRPGIRTSIRQSAAAGSSTGARKIGQGPGAAHGKQCDVRKRGTWHCDDRNRATTETALSSTRTMSRLAAQIVVRFLRAPPRIGCCTRRPGRHSGAGRELLRKGAG